MHFKPLLLSLLGVSPLGMLSTAQAASGNCQSLKDGTTAAISDCCSGPKSGTDAVSGNVFDYSCRTFKRFGPGNTIGPYPEKSARDCAQRCVFRSCTMAVFLSQSNQCYYTKAANPELEYSDTALALENKGKDDMTEEVRQAVAKCEKACEEQKQQIRDLFQKEKEALNAQCTAEKTQQGKDCEEAKTKLKEQCEGQKSQMSQQCQEEKNNLSAQCTKEKEEQSKACDDRVSIIDGKLTECRDKNTELIETINNVQGTKWVSSTGSLGAVIKAKAVAFSPKNGEKMAVGELFPQRVVVWDMKTKQVLTGWNTGTGAGMPTSVAWSPDGTKVLCGTFSGAVKMWDVATGYEQVFQDAKGSVNQVAFSPDGKQVAAGFADGKVLIWDVASKIVTTTAGHSDAVRALTFSPSSGKLVSGSKDKTIRFWDPRTGTKTHEIGNLGVGISAIAFSPDGKSLASGSDDNSVRVWNAETLAQRRVLPAHTGPINGLAFSADGRQLASASDDGTVRVWSLVDDYVLNSYQQRKVEAVAFSSDGKYLASVVGLEGLQLWARE